MARSFGKEPTAYSVFAPISTHFLLPFFASPSTGSSKKSGHS